MADETVKTATPTTKQVAYFEHIHFIPNPWKWGTFILTDEKTWKKKIMFPIPQGKWVKFERFYLDKIQEVFGLVGQSDEKTLLSISWRQIRLYNWSEIIV